MVPTTMRGLLYLISNGVSQGKGERVGNGTKGLAQIVAGIGRMQSRYP